MDFSTKWTDLLRENSAEPSHNPYLLLHYKIHDLHPNSQHFVIKSSEFGLDEFLKEKKGFEKDKLHLTGFHGHHEWVAKDLTDDERKAAKQKGLNVDVEHLLELAVRDGVMKFTYEGTDFLVYKASWNTKDWVGRTRYVHHMVWDGPDDSAGRALATAVFKWAEQSTDSIWVYQNGSWTKDKGLYSAIQESKWEDIVLEKDFSDRLRRDTETFFSSAEIYHALNVAWKRGILLIGQPGLGKTETIKVLLKESNKPALYVKSFNTDSGAEQGIRAIFEQARVQAPCILVLEDLDSLIKDNIRSFFLNELDGLEKNDGILTIATTNHAEKIDDSILNRPSRFDTKYFFNYPTWNLRVVYCTKWLQKAQDVGGLDFDDPAVLAERVADKTEGWSFAFLKELFVSFLLRKASEQSRGETSADKDAKSGLLAQVEKLADQVQSGMQAVGDANVAGGAGPWVRPSQAALIKSQANMYM